jgi:uncharacterized protein YggU (UPF0235/DUF167 family)
VPKSDVDIARGDKSRDKTVVVYNMANDNVQESCEDAVRRKFLEAIDR